MLRLFSLVPAFLCAFLSCAALETLTNDEGQEFLVSESLSENVVETDTPTEMASAETTSTRDFSNILQDDGVTLQGHVGEGGGTLRFVDVSAIESICGQSEWPEEEAGYFVRYTSSDTGIQPEGAIFYGKTSIWTTETAFTNTETITSSITVSTLKGEEPTSASRENNNGEEDENSQSDSAKEPGEKGTDESVSEESVSQDETRKEGGTKTEEGGGGGGILTVTSTNLVDAVDGDSAQDREDESSSAQGRREETFICGVSVQSA